MMKNLNHPLRKTLAAVLAVLLVLTQALALASPAQQEVGITLNYTRQDGSPVSEMAVPVPYAGYENAFWLYISPEAQAAADASLTVSDLFARYPGGFSIQPGTPASTYYMSDARDSLEGPFVEFFGQNEQMQPVATYRLYISLMAPQPVEPQPTTPVINPVDITIHYVDHNQTEFATEIRAMQPGQNYVTPDQSRVPANYQLTSAGEVVVTVTENGADQTDVYFTYQVQINPVDIMVHLVKTDNTEFDVYTFNAQPGQNVITPDQSRVPANYQLTGAGEVVVTVTENGADQTDVYFTYQVQINPVDITVHLVKSDNTEFDVYTFNAQPGQNVITPDQSRVPANYQLTSAGEVVVTVTENGADQTDVYFTYQVQINPVDIMVHLVKTDNTEFDVYTFNAQPGQNVITPDQSRVPANYQLTGAGEVVVTVTENGADQTDVYFTYQVQINPVDITVHLVKSDNTEFDVYTFNAQPGQNVITPDQSRVPANYQLTGAGEVVVTVTENGADQTDVYFTYQVQINPVDITVHLVKSDNTEFDVYTFNAQPGQNVITPDQSRVPANYQLTSAGEVVVTVTENGADQTDVYFTYQVQINPVDIMVHLVKTDNTEFDVYTFNAQPGQNVITPDQSRVPANYQLTGAGEVVVTVTENGADQTDVYFTYQVQINPVDITVHLVKSDNTEFDVYTFNAQPGQNVITPDQSRVPANYQLTGAGEVVVTVAENGADQTDVYFTYQVQINPVDITIHYVDQNQVEFANEIRTLQPGQNAVTPDKARVPEGYTLTSPAEVVVTVTEQGVDQSDVTFTYQTPPAVTDAPTEEPIQPAQVPVHFRDEQGQEVAPSIVVTVQPGTFDIYAQPEGLKEGYTPVGPDVQTVTVDRNGANPAEIVFVYKAPPVVTDAPTEEPIQPAQVPVHFRDEQGQEVAPSIVVTVQPGTFDIYAQPEGLKEGYTPAGPDVQTVTVDRNGANPAEIVFVYKAPPVVTEAPTEEPVQPAQVPVHFRDEQGQEVAPSIVVTVQPGTFDIYAQPEGLKEGYTPAGPDVQTVTVDKSGANPAEIVFVYKAPPVVTEAPTEEPVQPAQVPVHFRDEQGQEVAPSIVVTVQPGTFDIYAQPEGLKEGYTPAGPDVQTVTVDKSGANPAEVVFVYKAPPVLTEAPTEEPVQPVQITVNYVDDKGNKVAESQQVTLQEGTTTISPTPANLLPGHELTGQPAYDVTVTRDGASMTTINFVYMLVSPVSQPVNVIVSYVDEQGVRIAQDAVFTLGEGKHPIQASPVGMPSGYALRTGEDAVKYVTVTNNKADPSSLVFVYTKVEAATSTPAPVPKAALVNVLYKNEAGDVLFSTTAPCKEGEQTIISVDYSRINGSVYQLISEPSFTITVDAAGNPSMRDVVFLFKDITIKTADLVLHYRDDKGATLAASQTVTLVSGTHKVPAAPSGLPQGYVLVSQSPVEVTVSQSGALSVSELVFIYQVPATATPVVTATPEATVLPFDVTTMDRYAYPTGETINFRSSPDSASKDNILKVVSQKDLAHILGMVKNKQGEEWYLADVAGQEGFLRATVVRLLEFNEVAALFGWTPTPAPEPQVSDRPFADGEVIDRWAEVTTSGGVNFRAKASTSSTRIATLERGERFWVYSQETVGKDVWYKIMANGKEGYVVSTYSRLYSEEESRQYQAALATPMPYVATPTPTLPPVTDTPVTATPTIPATPEATATPAAYHGPALTIRQTALRTGVSRQDEPVMEMLEVNALVQVWSQTWIGAEGWSQVQVMADKQVGYVPTASLRYIDEQEAAFYLAQLQPQATSTPAPTRQPDQRTGYSISRGENVPVRAFPDTNAQIITLLPEGAVVGVRGQEYVAGATWDVIQYGIHFGYVRSDQLRMMDTAEEQNYLNSLRTPTPAPVATPEPVTLNSPSSYGYVNADRVRLRAEASTSSRELKLMSKNAFALVYGSTLQQDGTWYHISQDGTVGYIHGDFFSVLPMGELSTYLQSPEYLNANSASIPVAGGYQQPNQITPLENYNATVWQNPSLISASYEPFNPLGSPTPAVEAIQSPSPTPTTTPSPTLMTVEAFEEPPTKPDSGFPTGILAVGLISLLGGGGYYAYHLYNQNQKRAAARAAQRRAQAAQQAGQPQARPAAQQPSPYAPPRPGTQGTPQGTVQFRPGMAPPVQGQAGQPPVSQGTTQYRPGMTPPAQGQAGQPPMSQGTTQYRPGMTPPAQGQVGQPPVPQGTTQYRPGMAPPAQPGSAQATQAFTPQRPPQQPSQNAEGVKAPEPKAEGSQTPEQRRRRSDRHDNT